MESGPQKMQGGGDLGDLRRQLGRGRCRRGGGWQGRGDERVGWEAGHHLRGTPGLQTSREALLGAGSRTELSQGPVLNSSVEPLKGATKRKRKIKRGNLQVRFPLNSAKPPKAVGK